MADINQESQFYVDNYVNQVNMVQLKRDDQFMNSVVGSLVKHETFLSMFESKKGEDRSEKDCKLIADFLKTEKYFQRISKNVKILMEISSWIEFKKYKAGEFIYKINDYAECFYIIVKGEVHLTEPEKELIQEEEEIKPEESESFSFKSVIDERDEYISSQSSFFKRTNTNHHSKMEQKSHIKKKRLNKQTSLHEHLLTFITVKQIKPVQVTPKPVIKLQQMIVNVFGVGQCFGDLQNIVRRGTNAIAKQECHLLIIKKQHYQQISKAQLKSTNKIKYEFLSSLELFRLVVRYTIESMLYLLQEVNVSYNNIIYKEEQALKYIYIVYKGEFKYYKKVKCNKEELGNTCFLENKEKRNVYRNISFKSLEIGEILAHLQSYHKVDHYKETCVCKSQEGVVFKIDKNKFFKKLFNSDNNIVQLKSYFEEKYVKKQAVLAEVIEKQENNTFFIKYLHTPTSACRRRSKTEHSEERQRKGSGQKEMRKLSGSNNNFFDNFNKTIYRQENNNRISIKKAWYLPQRQQFVPRGIRDIVEIVNQQTNYHKIRKPKENITLFDFNINKVPLHVKKKYETLFKRYQKK